MHLVLHVRLHLQVVVLRELLSIVLRLPLLEHAGEVRQQHDGIPPQLPHHRCNGELYTHTCTYKHTFTLDIHAGSARTCTYSTRVRARTQIGQFTGSARTHAFINAERPHAQMCTHAGSEHTRTDQIHECGQETTCEPARQLPLSMPSTNRYCGKTLTHTDALMHTQAHID
jgi:hypothetical protein